MRLEVVLGDITEETSDVVVNAANNGLLPGSGVAGAIHQAAGPKLEKLCKEIGGCHTGQAVITPGFDLPAEWIIHTVGPIWHGGSINEEALLRSCYVNSLQLASEHQLKTIAFPSLSTGAFGYPLQQAASTAIKAISETPVLEYVRIVAFDESAFKAYSQALAEHRFLGTWINQSGSILTIGRVNENVVEGTFQSAKGRVSKDDRYPVRGVINHELIAFQVDFGDRGSIVSFSGRLNEQAEIETIWVLARAFTDAANSIPSEPWNTFLVNHDHFRRQS